MSSCDRRTLIVSGLALAGLAGLVGCGFTPVYGPDGGAAALQNSVAVKDPRNRNEFDLSGALIAKLGATSTARYELSYDLSISTASVAISSTNTTTRRDLIGTARYRLTRISDDSTVASGSTRAFTGYSTTGSTQATQTARDDAGRRLMQILADQIVQDLIGAASDL